MDNLNAKFNISSRVQIVEINKNHYGIHKVIKSRIIRKDAQKIVDIAEKIKDYDPHIQISLICSHNICSKSLALFKENHIDVKYQEI